MAAAVDYCPPSAIAGAPTAGMAAPVGFTCAACADTFTSAVEQRAHCKSERHVYNTKRKLAGLKPISQEAWERKLRESLRGGAEKNKGTAHLKAGKEPRNKGGYEASSAPVAPAQVDSPEPEEAEPWTPETSLFDRKRFDTVDACLEYMWKTYSFQVPDREYCTNLPGLLEFLHDKITKQPYACLYCNRRFADAGAVRRHMLDMSHTRVGTEARTRRGRNDENGSVGMQNELEAFYDFHGSTREITERMRDPRQKVASLLRFFDADRDGCLQFKELAQLWSAANDGAELSEAEYRGACAKAEADPEVGLDDRALHCLYIEGLADLDAHFAMLQDALTQKLSSRARARREAAEAAIAEEEDEDDEDDEEEDEEEEDEDEDDDSDGTEVLECDDDEEFEEVMRVLGLQQATLLENGDLQLPNGCVAAHRDVKHIWKQRGQRMSQLAIQPGRPNGRPQVRTPLMLTANAHGATRIAMTARAQAREGKKMVAILRQQQHHDMRMGMRQNILLKKNTAKIRTQFGDASGGR